MDVSVQIKEIRRICILSQESFAREIGVSFSTVNRWEQGKSKPNYKAMRNIHEFCAKNKIEIVLVSDRLNLE